MTFNAETVKKVAKKVLIGLIAVGGVILLAKAVNKGDAEDDNFEADLAELEEMEKTEG
jgi:hypothetical protein